MGLAAKLSVMPSRKRVFGRFAVGIEVTGAAATNGPNDLASSVERAT